MEKYVRPEMEIISLPKVDTIRDSGQIAQPVPADNELPTLPISPSN